MAVVILHVHKYEKKVTRKFKSGENLICVQIAPFYGCFIECIQNFGW